MNRVIPGFILLILFPSLMVYSQISGVVNDYSEVLSIDIVNHSVEVADPTKFTTNDKVILMQMKGAEINESNSSLYGDINNLNGAGLYEIATVCNISGNDIYFLNQMPNASGYNPNTVSNPRMQLIKVPQYTDETVTGTLTAQPWNGVTGGVLAIELSGTLTLNADIDVSGQGFRGGTQVSSTYACSFLFPQSDYFYVSDTAGAKGEGIADFSPDKAFGRGAQVNGGGGGNDHNTGGGGGGNYNFGGLGGTRTAPGFADCKGNFPGAGGEGFSFWGYSSFNPYIFMGGGGGAGHDNDGEGNDGGNGGGIIIIIADDIEGNGNAIRANGESPGNVLGDGASGGGAGGVILLSSNTFGATALTVEATGGDGGSTTLTGKCPGAGGGGAGGVVWASFAAVPGNLTIDITNGAAGTPIGCGGVPAASAGNPGTIIGSLSIPQGTVANPGCVLTTQTELNAKTSQGNSVLLSWNIEGMKDGTLIQVERNLESGGSFELLEDLIFDMENPFDSWTDYFPEGATIRYRLKLTGPQGAVWYSNQVELTLSGSETFIRRVFPNPLTRSNTLNIQAQFADQQKVVIEVFDHTGKSVATFNRQANQGQNLLEIPVSELAEGVYLLKITHKNGQDVQSFLMVSD